MTTEAARDKKMGGGGQIKNFEDHYLLENSQKYKKKGLWMTRKSHQISKIGGHFANVNWWTHDPL